MGIRDAFHSTHTNRMRMSGLYCKCSLAKLETKSSLHCAQVLENEKAETILNLNMLFLAAQAKRVFQYKLPSLKIFMIRNY
jgi:hypothetical protein